MVRGSARRRLASTVGFYALAALFMLPTVFVFYWMLTLSLKPQIEATAYPPSFIRFSLTLAGYREVFTKYPFFLYTWNSLVVNRQRWSNRASDRWTRMNTSWQMSSASARSPPSTRAT